MGESKMPARIRVAQDADGFWTCREAVSGSPEYIRADLVEPLVEALRRMVSERHEPGSEAVQLSYAALQAYEAAQ